METLQNEEDENMNDDQEMVNKPNDSIIHQDHESLYSLKDE
jgi:hypothetical protein